jgi:hypothetical protein
MITKETYGKHLETIEFNIAMLHRHYDYLIDEGDIELALYTVAEMSSTIEYLTWVKNKLVGEIVEHQPSLIQAGQGITTYDEMTGRYTIMEVTV